MKLTPGRHSFRYDLGTQGEIAAWAFLEKKGFQILEKNFRCPLGEIDIVAAQGRRIRFVEVKTRTSNRYGEPEEAVTLGKQKKIIRLAQWYLKARKKEDMPISFDVIAVSAGSGQALQIRYIPNAFEVGDERE